ncbi:P-loop containing nucleoside triphosphate hydrolase protein [Daldinia loculata]|uniref:P-loop containing nucleoside triphosphate hydrolase protein n=1 Tax=Daldinia loculata TaxID=103429 RepID=UPI0020C254EB|nr:P-loop containing nucleoside triphosphate hydrolase protein [Daldinia loculata]KAI1642874.1 P-loop containing nucleoside triphosphate hydrolase protein [Daldinia loculata]
METTSKSQQFRLPISKSFSFIIPDKWKTNPAILRWIDNVPGPAKREESLGPARIQTPKRAFETPDIDDSRDDDSYRAKRTKMVSSLSNKASLSNKDANNRRASFASYGHGLIRRASNICRQVISPEKPQETLEGSTVRGSLSLPGSPATLVDRPRMRFVFVGDSGCGKSNLLLRYYRDAFNPAHIRTHYELFSKVATVDGQDVDLELWDTSGDLSLHQLQLLSYLAWDAVFLCFSMENIARFKTVQKKWMDEIYKYCGDIPFILLGLKKDTFTGSNMRAPFHPDLNIPVSSTKDSSGAMIVRGIKYMECSAKTGENVNRVFEEAVRMVVYEREEQEALARIRQKYGESESTGLSLKMCFK